MNQSQVIQILDQIERELPALNLKAEERDEAHGLLASLRKVLADKLPEAAARAIGAALASIISAGGSDLANALLEALHISLG